MLRGILKKLGIKLTLVDTVWTPDTTPLWTLNMLFEGNVFKTSNFSVPIPVSYTHLRAHET